MHLAVARSGRECQPVWAPAHARPVLLKGAAQQAGIAVQLAWAQFP